MFCENCGTKIPDGSVFCENCGARLEAEPAPAPAPVQPAAPAAAAAPAKKTVTLAALMEKVKSIHQKNKLIFPIAGGVLIVAIALIILFSILGKQVSMKDYLDITMEGYDGYGQMVCDFGDVAFGMRAVGDKDSKGYDDYDNNESFLGMGNSDVSKDYRKNLSKAKKLVESVTIDYQLPEGKTHSTLANGDIITFTVECNEKVAEDLGLTIKDTEFTYKVEGLKPLEKFDVLSYFDLKCEGYDGYGKVQLVCNQSASKQLGDITFTMEAGEQYLQYQEKDGYSSSIWVYLDGDTYNKSNGDVMKAKLDISADYLVGNGIELTGLEKEFTVSGLQETTKVDLLQYYSATFTGLDGSGSVTVEPTQETLTVGDMVVDLKTGEWTKNGEYVTRTRVYVDGGWNLSNDSKVKLYFSPSESIFSTNGIKFTRIEQEIAVTGLATYITALSDIKSYSGREISSKESLTEYLTTNWGWAVHGSFFAGNDGMNIGDDMKLHKLVLTTPKSSTSYTKNTLWMIFSVTISDSKITTPTVYYFAISQTDAAVYADGSVYDDGSFSRHRGYDSYDTLYAELINSDNLNIDVSE